MRDAEHDHRPEGPRARTWVRRLLITILAVELLYVIAANVFLQTGLLDQIINTRPERMRISWQSAWTYFPGVVVVRGFELRNQSRADQIYISVERAHAVISLLKLPTKTLHVRKVNASDVDFRLRKRLDAPKFQEEGTASPPPGAQYFPEIPGFSNPPDPKPEEMYPRKEHPPKPWTIKLTGMTIRAPISVALNEVGIQAEGVVGGGMTLKPKDSITIHQARVDLAPLRVTIGPDLVTEDLQVRVAARAAPFALPKPAAADIIGGVSGTVAVEGRLGDRAAIARPIAPGITAGGSGTIDAEWKLARGVVQAGSRMSLDSDRFEVRLMGLRFVGSATVRNTTTKVGGEPVTSSHIELPDFRLEDADDRSIDVAGRGLTIDASWPTFNLVHPQRPSELAVVLPETEIRDVRALNDLLPGQVPLTLASGTGKVAARLEIADGGAATGEMTLDAEDIALATRGTVHRADLQVRATLADGDLEARRFDFSGTTLRVDDLLDRQLKDTQQQKLEPWYCELGVESGGITFGKPVAVDGEFTVAMYDIRPILALLREIGDPPGWLFAVPDIKDIDGRLGLELDAGRTALDDVAITGKGLEVLGWMHLQNKRGNGRIFVKYRGLAAGLGMKDGKSSIHLAAPRKWFDELPAAPAESAADANAIETTK